MAILKYCIKILLSLRQNMAYYLQYSIFDKLLSQKEAEPTEGQVKIGQLTIDPAHRELFIGYEPAPRLIIRWLHAYLPKNPPSWTFLDIGAGRGRVLLEAARYPYKRITGIEFSKELCNQAQNNITAYENQKKANILEIINADATNFDIPDGPCIFFLFNSFKMPVFEQFLSHTLKHLDKNKRENYIYIYYNPTCSEVFDKFPQISQLKMPLSLFLLFKLFSPFAVHIYTATSTDSPEDVWR